MKKKQKPNQINSNLVQKLIKRKNNAINVKSSTGRWKLDEHKRFIEAIIKYGNDWKQVEKYVKTRTSTQARSHAQKFLVKLKKAKIEGKVIVSFYVDVDGSIADVTVERGIGFGCDEEAVRVIKSMPNWNPGMSRGRKVKVRMVLPVTFKLS